MDQKWHLCQPQRTRCLDSFYHMRLLPACSVTRHIIEPFSLPCTKKDTNSPPFIYCLIKRLLVNFCISKTSMLVFPPHSAPFIIGWCRETYCSYISCNWSGSGPKVGINIKDRRQQNELFPGSFSPLPTSIFIISYVSARECLHTSLFSYETICHLLFSQLPLRSTGPRGALNVLHELMRLGGESGAYET